MAAFEAHGVKTSFRPDGSVSAIHTSNMRINYAASGARRVETVRPDNSVLVSTGPHQGYLQRTVVVNDRTVEQRIYVVNKTIYVRNYTTYTYRGVVLEHYVPGVYYAPAFYGWVYYPWPYPVRYRWAFYEAPWYGYYGGYFTPAPVYTTPSRTRTGPRLWLPRATTSPRLTPPFRQRRSRYWQLKSRRWLRRETRLLETPARKATSRENYRTLLSMSAACSLSLAILMSPPRMVSVG